MPNVSLAALLACLPTSLHAFPVLQEHIQLLVLSVYCVQLDVQLVLQAQFVLNVLKVTNFQEIHVFKAAHSHVQLVTLTLLA